MKRAVLVRVAPLALLLVTGMVSCSPNTQGAHTALAAKPLDQQRFGQNALVKARNAMAMGDAQGAASAAEIAVAALPDRADARALLGQAYLAQGRFASAESAFADSMSLDSNQPRIAFGHVLALIGAGRTEQARAALSVLPPGVSIADRGLALALTGQRLQAVTLLEDAAHAKDADARVRQNLALAYGLSGEWAKASAVAAQDVPASELAARLAGWAQFAQAPSAADQVALLLNTQRSADPGLPPQLALDSRPVPAMMAPAVLAPVEVASAEAPITAPTVLAPPPLLTAPSVEPQAVAVARVAMASPPPLLRAPTIPFKRMIAPLANAPRSIMLVAGKAFTAPKGGSFVVQLGAFRQAARVETAWSQTTGRMARLATYTPSSTTYLSTTHSATLTRLSIAGFASHDTAMALCSALRSAGGDCFVRQVAGDNPVHWASRDTTRRA